MKSLTKKRNKRTSPAKTIRPRGKWIPGFLMKWSLLTRVMVMINIILAIFLLLSYTSPFISPLKLSLPAFLGLAYPYLALINLGFVLFWLILFRGYFIISTLVILLGLNQVSSHFQIHKTEEVHNIDVIAKVMSYNVRMFDLYQWNRNEESAENILRAVVDLAPDILCIQDYYQNKKSKPSFQARIQKIHQLKQAHIRYWRESEIGGHGIATFSSFPIIHKEEVQLSSAPPVYALITDLLTPQDTIRVFNIHLSSYYFQKDDYDFMEELKDSPNTKVIRTGSLRVIKIMNHGLKERARQAEIIRQAIEASPYPVIVCGDFNDSPSGYAYRKVKGSLKDAFIESGSGLGRTYTGIFPSYRIDYILHDPRWRSVNFRVHHYKGSDHIPLVTYLANLN